MDTPLQLAQLLPLAHPERVQAWRSTVEAILRGSDPRLLLLVGPCSIHNVEAAYEYATRLAALAATCSDRFFIVMRAYCEKARTCHGWRGLALDNLALARRFLLDLVALGLPAACEFVDPLLAPYLADTITWGSIGARTVQSPIHRQLASFLPMPVGMKNPLDGHVLAAVQAAAVAQQPQTFPAIGNDGRIALGSSTGNPCPHVVLRGGTDGPNSDPASIERAGQQLLAHNLPAAVLVDCSHGNAPHYSDQLATCTALLQRPPPFLRGVMLESFLLPANQALLLEQGDLSRDAIAYGASRTDPCLDWQATAHLITQQGAPQCACSHSLS